MVCGVFSFRHTYIMNLLQDARVREFFSAPRGIVFFCGGDFFVFREKFFQLRVIFSPSSALFFRPAPQGLFSCKVSAIKSVMWGKSRERSARPERNG